MIMSLTRTRTGLTIHALGNATTLPYVWLRDSCQSPQAVHPSTRQKLHRTSDVPPDIAPTHVHLAADGSLQISWVDGHQSVFDRRWLQSHVASPTVSSSSSFPTVVVPAAPIFVSYQDILSSQRARLQAMQHLCTRGLLFVRQVPIEHTQKLAEIFGDIRMTFYGLLWDVVNLKKDSKNIAYTNLDLGLHMDLLYFEHPPRYQVLHCLRNRVLGGTSIFVDALHAANLLRHSSPSHFDVLTKTPVSFHYINDGHHLQRDHFTIQLAPSSSSSPPTTTPKIAYINYSPPFQAPLPLATTPPEFYPALRKFADLLDREENAFRHTLAEGDAVLFDNRRLLHARTAFRDKEEGTEREPSRWLKGCYFEADALLDRVRILSTKF